MFNTNMPLHGLCLINPPLFRPQTKKRLSNFNVWPQCLKPVATQHSSLTVVNPVNHTKDRGIRQPHNLVVLPYTKGISKKIARVLSQHNIKVAHKPVRTVGSLFKRPKDQQNKEDKRGTVYKIKCNDCAAVYIGQTSRASVKNQNQRTFKSRRVFRQKFSTGAACPRNWPQLWFWKRVNSKHLYPMEPEVVLRSMVFQ